MDPIQLRDDLVTAFNEAELAQLCSRFGLTYDTLPGNNQRDKVAVLIGTLERRGRLRQLVKEVAAERPHLAARYQRYLHPGSDRKEDHLSWLDQIAAGQGAPIEEPPTMTWDSEETDKTDRS
ncbi:MAG TPA: effector-associated domain EAD1-containing protein [Anaerolineae bacterium]